MVELAVAAVICQGINSGLRDGPIVAFRDDMNQSNLFTGTSQVFYVVEGNI